MSKRWITRAIPILALLFVYSCGDRQQKMKFDAEYQAVFLSNGQVFFGKIEDVGSPFPLLREVYYVQNTLNPETKQTVSILVKRGSEWHSPDRMYINSSQILVIEPVSANSSVAKLIAEARKQKPEGGK